MRNWIYYRGKEYRFHRSYGWVKRESNDVFNEETNNNLKIEKMKNLIRKQNVVEIPSNNFQSFSEDIFEVLDWILSNHFSEFIEVIDKAPENHETSLKLYFLEKLKQKLDLNLNTLLEYRVRLLIIVGDYLEMLKNQNN
ncbi:hypothetical protein [Sphingobacterium sp. FBM7-1]|uniref:hypothetical protein n=1 Tax=Sphingobacterium sp. FBM7-1 TaxID=2886688 RepID=UPI001D121049|nr:hypothetical protein [Sphingobacterium sp. FBM7-1]MCC2599781.1 hypothetical protein [Sphingobacterium sp. FBM7-1]